MASVNKKVIFDKNDLRRLMKEKKGSSNTNDKKVESPYAKYNAVGQLWCTLCNCPVKTYLLWNTHIQGRTHKENLIARLKPGPVQASTSVNPLKRKADISIDDDCCSGAERKLMRVSVEVASSSSTLATSVLPLDFFESKSSTASNAGTSTTAAVPLVGLAPDFFDKQAAAAITDIDQPAAPVAIAEKLPEGFFDDPKMDAKVRQVPYKDKIEDEWELFQKTIKEETIVSEALVEEDDEMREEERNIEEIDDQLNRWSRMTSLLKKKEEIASHTNMQHAMDDTSDSDELEPTADFDEFLDWRSKKAWK